jgi:hypothetical protein
MRNGSILYNWYLEAFGDERERIRAVDTLLRSGHTGLAESVVVKSLKAKYDKTTPVSREGIRVNESGHSYII